MWIFRIIYEAVLIAWYELVNNLQRTILSLLGIGIGIFCIIAILSAVDSLKIQLKEQFEELGSNVIYVSKFSWSEPPNQNWWKYERRPNPSFKDYRALRSQLQSAQATIYVATSFGTIKNKNNSTSGGYLMAVSQEYPDIYDLNIESGRFFSELEMNHGHNVAIIGHEISQVLFGEISPIGKRILMKGNVYTIVGKFKDEGKAILNPIDYNYMVMIPYETGNKIINYDSKYISVFIAVKYENRELASQVKDDITQSLRSVRKLKPSDESNFELNELSLLDNIIDSIFSVLNIVGIIIGGFAVLVGMFSVANIMFVSVQERTKLIGIKKAIGAPKYVVLLEFLIEAIVLCCIGGMIGLLFVYGALYLISYMIDFSLVLSIKNIAIGIIISVVIGVISGILPAYRAASMDPVEAMR